MRKLILSLVITAALALLTAVPAQAQQPTGYGNGYESYYYMPQVVMLRQTGDLGDLLVPYQPFPAHWHGPHHFRPWYGGGMNWQGHSGRDWYPWYRYGGHDWQNWRQ
jgi:hypothetical protein